MAGGQETNIPVMYFDFLILAPTRTEEDELKADDLRTAVDESEILRAAKGGALVKVELIEEASGYSSDFLSLLDKGVKLTTAVLAIITETYCQGRDEEAIAKFVTILTDRIQGVGADKVQLIPVYMPHRLSDSSFRKLPAYIRGLHSYIFDPCDDTVSNRFFRKVAALMKKPPFQNRKKAIIGRLLLEEAKQELTEKTESFELELRIYKNKTEHLQKMRKLDEEMKMLKLKNAEVEKTPPALLPNQIEIGMRELSTERQSSVSMPPMRLFGPDSRQSSEASVSSPLSTSSHYDASLDDSSVFPMTSGCAATVLPAQSRIQFPPPQVPYSQGIPVVTAGANAAPSIGITDRSRDQTVVQSEVPLAQSSRLPTPSAAMKVSDLGQLGFGQSQLSGEGPSAPQTTTGSELMQSRGSQSDNQSQLDTPYNIVPDVFRGSPCDSSDGNSSGVVKDSRTFPKSSAVTSGALQGNGTSFYVNTPGGGDVPGDFDCSSMAAGGLAGDRSKIAIDGAECSEPSSGRADTHTASMPDTEVIISMSSIS